MKQYITNLLLICGLLVAIMSLLLGTKYYIANHLNWNLPKDKHILFMGASHVCRGFDDSLTKGVVNLGSMSERYLFTYIKMQHYVEANPQIDTVFLQCSSTDLWQNTDYKYHTHNEQSFFISAYWPLLNKEQWKVFTSEPKQVFNVIIASLSKLKYFNRDAYVQSLGGYLNRAAEKTSFDATKEMPQLAIDINKDSGWYGNSVNYKYLRMIIDYCAKHNIKLYLVYFPVFKPEFYYDQTFCDNIRKKYFYDVEYLDYSHWEADDNERLDAHHLNYNGAKRFTEELKILFNFE